MGSNKNDYALRFLAPFTVSAGARRFIQSVMPTYKSNYRGLARRATVIKYIEQRLETLSALYPYWDDEPLSPSEVQESADAVELLRRLGKSDAEIRAWFNLQRARYVIAKEKSRA